MVSNNFFAKENKRILICRVKFGALKILGVNSILLSTNMIFQASEGSLDLHSNSRLVLYFLVLFGGAAERVSLLYKNIY